MLIIEDDETVKSRETPCFVIPDLIRNPVISIFLDTGLRDCVAMSPAGGGRGWTVNVAVMLIEVTGRKSFVHLRHCVTPPPAEDME
jgi:hypothetical protein